LSTSNIAVTAGSGTLLDTWTTSKGGQTVHAQRTIPAEYPDASYFVMASNISIATANDHVLEILAGSSLNLLIRRIYIEQATNATTVTGCSFELLRVTTAGTGGGAITPAKFNTADAAAGCTAMTLPTVKGTESTSMFRTSMIMRQAMLATGAQVDDAFQWDQSPYTGPIFIAAGTSNGIALKCISAVAAATVNVRFEIVETNYTK
jgi:hypothetical protein